VAEVESVQAQVMTETPLFATVEGEAEIVAPGFTTSVTTTFTLSESSPPSPVQVRVKPVGTVRAEEVSDPEVALEPLHPPEAVQESAFTEVHAKAVVCPEVTSVGVAVRVTTGGGSGVLTMTVALALADPPFPSQVRMKVVVAVSAPDEPLPPDVDLEPLHPPEAVQAVAFATVHVRVDADPESSVVGEAVSVTVGFGAGATETVTESEPVPVRF